MKLFRFCRRSLLALPVFFVFTACDQLAPPPAGGTGKRVEPIIRSVRVRDYIDYGETSGTRSAGGEKRIVGQPIVQDLGGGMFAEISVEEDVSALRADSDPKDLDNGAKFRIIALNEGTSTIYSWADYTAAGSGTLEPIAGNLHVVSGVKYDFVCFSYNSTTADWPAALNEGGTLGSITVTNANDFLYKKLTAQKLDATNNTLSFTLEQQFVKAKLKLKGGSKTITDIADNSISLNAGNSGSFNLKDGEFSSSSGSINFSGWSGYNSTEVTSGAVTFISQAKYTFSFAAEAISWKESTNTGKTTEGPIGSFQFTFAAGSSYTVTLTILRLPKFAGSNIYWDGANSRLTFDPYGINNDHAKYQGVYFKWGSLIGVAAGKGSESYTAGSTVLYKPTNTSDPVGTARTWEITNDTDDDWSGNGWENIPSYYGTFMSEDETLLSKGETGFAGFKGDICYYIDQNYRMPTKDELAAIIPYHKDFTDGSISESKADGTYEVPTQYTTLAGIIFPASGSRDSSSGTLDNSVGRSGCYWSGSALSGTNAAYHLFFDYISVDVSTYDIGRSYGYPVRCVKN